MNCSNGHPLPWGAQFCPTCGATVGPGAPPPPQPAVAAQTVVPAPYTNAPPGEQAPGWGAPAPAPAMQRNVSGWWLLVLPVLIVGIIIAANNSDSGSADNNENKLACRSARREVGKIQPVLNRIGEGSALPMDAAEPFGKAQREFEGIGTFAEGRIGELVRSEASTLGRLRVALVTNDVDSLASATAAQSSTLAELDRLCDELGE